MKLVAWDVLVDNGFSASSNFSTVRSHIVQAIGQIKWPPGNDVFAIYPESGRRRGEGNGVKVIKGAFISHLFEVGWELERDRFDAHYAFGDHSALPFVVEWETGNVSSSHRSINRMALGMLQGEVSGGVLVVPSRALYMFLTDRIGNAAELMPYHPLWRLWSQHREFGYLAVVTVEHDTESWDAPRLPKATDGRAGG